MCEEERGGVGGRGEVRARNSGRMINENHSVYTALLSFSGGKIDNVKT